MWFWGLLAVTVITLWDCHLVGRSVLYALNWGREKRGRFWLAPVVGVAIFLLLASLVGKLGFTFTTPLCLLITLTLTFAALITQPELENLPVELGWVALFGIVTSLPLYFGILRFDGFNPYNDVYTYLVHGQWLQTHGFLEGARLSGSFPAETQVAFYQDFGLRFGSSFFLAWMQALFGISWSFQIYPAVVVIPSAILGLSIVGTARSIAPAGEKVAWIVGMLPAVTLSGFSHGALWGFLPQAYGLTLTAGGLALFAEIFRKESEGEVSWKRVLPSALCFAAVGYSYSEIFPFVVIAVGLSWVSLTLIARRRQRALIEAAAWLAMTVLILLNTECVRIIRALLAQAGAVVGGPVDWSPLHFLGHAVGFLTANGDSARWLLFSPVASAGVSVALVLVVLFCLYRFVSVDDQIRLLPFYALVLLLGLAFTYFRLIADSPWPAGAGHTWNQFKLSNWISPFVFLLIAVGLSSLTEKWRRLEVPILSVIVVWGLWGLTVHYELTESRTQSLRQFTGYEEDPFQAYLNLRMRVLAAVDPEESVFLDLGGEGNKNRQMITYFLSDRKLAGYWKDDGYFWILPESEKVISKDEADWVVLSEARGSEGGAAGRFRLRPLDSSFSLERRQGGYEIEEHDDGWCIWTANTLSFRFQQVEKSSLHFKVRFRYMAAQSGQHVRLTVRQGDRVDHFEVVMNGVWEQWESPPISRGEGPVELEFSSSAPARRISPADPRLLSFAVKNLKIEPAGSSNPRN